MGVCCSKHNSVDDEHNKSITTGTTAEALTTAGLTVSLAAGAGLLDVAAHIPFVAPVAFLIGAIILSCQEAESLRSDCKEFSMVAQEVERVLLKAKDLHKEKEAVESIQAVLEEGMAFVRTLNKTNVVLQVIGSKHNANELKSCRDRLLSLINTMTFSGVVDLNIMMDMKFEEEKKLDLLVKNMGGPEAVVNNDEKTKEIAEAMQSGVEAMNLLLHKHTHAQSAKILNIQEDHGDKLDEVQKQLEQQRELSLHNKEQADVMARQNQLLMQQVQQMNMMMAQSQMQLNEFMTRFPLRQNEAAVQVAIEKLGIELLDKPIDLLEDLLDEFILFPSDPSLQLIMVNINVITAEDQVILASRAYNQYDEAWNGRLLKSEAENPFFTHKISKKSAVCQYTVAEDKVVCYRGKDKPAELISGSDYFDSITEPLSKADENVGKTVEKLASAPGFDVAMKAVSGEITYEKAREVAVRMGQPLKAYKKVETFARALSLLHAEDGLYLGSPWRIEGKTMGVCCCFIKAKPEDQLSNEEMIKKLELDKFTEKVQEAIDAAVKTPAHRRKVNTMDDAPPLPTVPSMAGGKIDDVRYGQVVPVSS